MTLEDFINLFRRDDEYFRIRYDEADSDQKKHEVMIAWTRWRRRHGKDVD